jgi:hypothetical protein
MLVCGARFHEFPQPFVGIFDLLGWVYGRPKAPTPSVEES